jgi:hypothetical protein
MTRKTRKAVAFAIVLLSVGTVTAFAATSPPLVGVTKNAMNGVNRAAGANGALKPNAVGNRQIKFGSVSCGKLSQDLKAAICTGKPGAPGTPGAPGANGNNGAGGAKGDGGSKGGNGSDGTNGSDGPAAQYGVATVNVTRGTSTAAWATYSTRLGSPVGDTTGGVFRFTCSTSNAPCTVAVRAAVLSYQSATYTVYPRVLLTRQDYTTPGADTYCEYGDGSTGNGSDGAPVAIAKQIPSSAPDFTAMQLNIGGSADCGGPVTTAGNVDQITVPAGYYDVQSTFSFRP